MKRLQFLDSLRGIAALYVLFFHMSLIPTFKPEAPDWLRPIVMFGGTGVALFFVVSAFSLCMTMPRHEQSSGLLSYYLSRFFRIAPLFYVLIVVTYIRDIYVFGVYHSAWKVFVSSVFIFNIIPGEQEGFVWAGWTVGVEMIFYAVFPFIYYVAKGITRKVGLLFAALAVYLVLPRVLVFFDMQPPLLETYQHFSIIQIVPVFIIGMAAFEIWKYLLSLLDAPDFGLALISFSFFGLLGMALGDIKPVLVAGWHMYALLYATLLLGLSLYPWKILVNPVTQFFGTISYSFYLWHANVVYFCSPIYRVIYSVPLPRTIAFAVCGIVAVAITTVISYLTYRLIEIPGMKIGKILLARLSKPQTEAVKV